MKDFTDLLTRGVREITVEKDLRKKLTEGRKLRIKHGVDPTNSDLHLGYAVIYRKLRAFQELGHTIVFLIGDFTGRFGDPTDKEKSRAMRTKNEVESAARSYIKQIGIMLDVNKLEIRRNSEWYDKMSAEELLRLMSRFTVARMLERDMFQHRIYQGREIGMHEPVYPILQAYDSVMLKSDLTVIGTDQTFNELQARSIQPQYNQIPQDVMSMDILVGTDGKQKMSQSLGNAIPIISAPEDMYGKIMSLPDTALVAYFTLLTQLPLSEITEMMKDTVHLMEHKKTLAYAIVADFNGQHAADGAQKHFESVFQQKKFPSKIPTVSFKAATLADAVAKLFDLSKSEARRQIIQKGIKVNGNAVIDPSAKPISGTYQKGKRHFMLLKLKK